MHVVKQTALRIESGVGDDKLQHLNCLMATGSLPASGFSNLSQQSEILYPQGNSANIIFSLLFFFKVKCYANIVVSSALDLK